MTDKIDNSKNIVLTGSSCRYIACAYIGLRSEKIAALRKDFHACHHCDREGRMGATPAGALKRAARSQGQPIMEAMKTKVTWVQSGLNFHSTAMFLDDRPSTQQLRGWFWQLVRTPQS